MRRDDDAVGEAYDKVARTINTLSWRTTNRQLATQGQDVYDFPRGLA